MVIWEAKMLTDWQKSSLVDIDNYIQNELKNDFSGHDIEHIRRVVFLSQQITEKEQAINRTNYDLFLILVSAYLHDVIDDKIVTDTEAKKEEVSHYLQSLNFSDTLIDDVFLIIERISFRKNKEKKQLLTNEGKIVQDADRLDAIGAIGIGRAFYYGSNRKQPMYDDEKNSNGVIQHFYDKLFLLKDKLNTETAKMMAEKRHNMMVTFVKQFKSEWNEKTPFF